VSPYCFENQLDCYEVRKGDDDDDDDDDDDYLTLEIALYAP
jgi:hypothetical protein